MAPGVATKVIAAGCGLTAFTVGILSGLFAQNPADTILLRALVALVVGQVAGYLIGMIGERTVAEAAKKYEKDRPIGAAKPAVNTDSGQAGPKFSP